MKRGALAWVLAIALELVGQSAAMADDLWSLHFQSTTATQAHPAFTAKYSGKNSLSSEAESATAFVSTLFLDVEPLPSTEIIFNPEISGGRGLSQTLGVAAFPSGIVYRVGDVAPVAYVARLIVRHSIGLGGGKVKVEPGPNQVAGWRDRDSLTFTVGRFSLGDVFDGAAFAHDSQTQFFNWALFASGAWDYPADTRGYTWSAVFDLSRCHWSFRGGIALEPKYANLLQMEWDVTKARGLMAEVERRWDLGGLAGAARILVFLNDARMGSYQQVLDDPTAYGNNVEATRAFGRTKYGAAVSVEQRLGHSMAGFLRASFNDGANETWAFAEIDRSVALGAVRDGLPLGRRNDQVGAAIVVDGLSDLHRAYLRGGGYGFILGDGALHYRPEIEGDFYYRAQINDWAQLSLIYQPVINPAYNQDRGPVHIFTARLRVAF